jgi:hypothetical protein
MDSSIKDSLAAQLASLSPELQRRVLDFAKSLSLKGVEGRSLLRFKGLIPADDLKMMSAAIEEGCEKKVWRDQESSSVKRTSHPRE